MIHYGGFLTRRKTEQDAWILYNPNEANNNSLRIYN